MPVEDKGKTVCDRNYVDARLADLDRYYSAQIEALNRAIDKAEQQLKERLAGMNEIRESMRDQAANFATQKEVDLKVGALEQAIRSLELSRASLIGISSVIAFLVSLVVAVISILVK